MKVVLPPQAEEDLDTVHDPVFSRIVRRLRLLERLPELGAPMIGPFAGYWSTVVAMFRLLYRVLPRGVVEAAYVRHCRRAPPDRAVYSIVFSSPSLQRISIHFGLLSSSFLKRLPAMLSSLWPLSVPST